MRYYINTKVMDGKGQFIIGMLGNRVGLLFQEPVVLFEKKIYIFLTQISFRIPSTHHRTHQIKEFFKIQSSTVIHINLTIKTKVNVYLYIRNFENSRLKLVFRYAIFICICVGRQGILNGYCVVEKLMLNVRI